jgi:hypothetical protein
MCESRSSLTPAMTGRPVRTRSNRSFRCLAIRLALTPAFASRDVEACSLTQIDDCLGNRLSCATSRAGMSLKDSYLLSPGLRRKSNASIRAPTAANCPCGVVPRASDAQYRIFIKPLAASPIVSESLGSPSKPSSLSATSSNGKSEYSCKPSLVFATGLRESKRAEGLSDRHYELGAVSALKS